MIVAVLALGACGDDGGGTGGPTGSGTMAGQVVVSGPLRGATISIDQIDLEDPDGNIRAHVADATTDADGRFTVETGQFNGLFVVTASGGSFTDLANDAMIQLDATDELKSLTYLDLFEVRDDVLVSPVGHLIEARTRVKLATYANVADAHEDAADHLNKHFGNVDWTRLKLGSLATPATSPTESVRSALVQAALSYLTQDIALAAGASPQEVNVFTLTQALAADLGEGTFDGNDGNTMIPGGLQVGVCGPVEGCVVPGGGCVVGACRPFCDLYAGTPRALLASAMAKVSSLPINQTGLGTADILAVARSINDNVDEDLFASCIENLDRSPPSLAWETPTPTEGTYVRGAVTLRVRAYDDTDTNPMVMFDGYADTDASNPTAQATIDTSSLTDGPLVVVATATDMANNKKTEQRSVVVDNTAPTLTIASTGYFVDGTTWWTASATPTLTGTLTDVAPATIKAVIGGVDYPGTISGATWSVVLPAGAIKSTGDQVTLVASDVAGNTGQKLQMLRYDGAPPVLDFLASTVRTETEVLGDSNFRNNPSLPDLDEAPIHVHTGNVIDLVATGACPSITKFAYLLGSNYTGNPILYHLTAGDDGVGINATGSQYRVGRRDPATGVTQWVLDWTSVGAGTPISSTVTGHDITFSSNVIPGLATNEGIYDVAFRATDRLGRPSAPQVRCFDLKLRAAPLRFATIARPMLGFVPGAAKGHSYALNGSTATNGLSLAPGAPYDAIATRLLNANATGASLLDMPVTNGTTSTVYLTVAVTKPTTINVSQKFERLNVYSTPTAVAAYTCSPSNQPCDSATTGAGPTYLTGMNAANNVAGLLKFPVRVFQVDNNTGALGAEIPCLTPCTDADPSFRFALPPRSSFGSSPPKRFLVMTMVGQVQQLWPSDATHPDSAPYVDTTLDGIRITGKISAGYKGCSNTFQVGTTWRCDQQQTVTPYRLLTEVKFVANDVTSSSYATAPTATLLPIQGATGQAPLFTWLSNEGTRP